MGRSGQRSGCWWENTRYWSLVLLTERSVDFFLRKEAHFRLARYFFAAHCAIRGLYEHWPTCGFASFLLCGHRISAMMQPSLSVLNNTMLAELLKVTLGHQ